MKKPSSHSTTESEAVQAASRWQVRHEAGLTSADRAAFDAWIAAHPSHALAWQHVATTARMLERLRLDSVAALDALRGLEQRRRRRAWRVLAGGALATGLAAAAVFVFVLPTPPAPPASPVAPAVSPPKPAVAAAPAEDGSELLRKAGQRLLEDGSRIELNEDARILVHYTPERREVTLLAGEALFTVAKNPARPFVVRSGHVEVRAVGTAFSVQLATEGVDVLVTEGKVAVARTVPADDGDHAAARPADSVLVAAGSMLVMPAAASAAGAPAPRAISQAGINRRLAWTRPRLELSGTALADAVPVLNRENALQIVVDDPALARLRLTGSFLADDAEGFVHVLTSHYHVQAERREDGALVLRSR